MTEERAQTEQTAQAERTEPARREEPPKPVQRKDPLKLIRQQPSLTPQADETAPTVWERYQELEETIRRYNPAADFSKIRAAFEYADLCHEGQRRKSGEPYIIHPLAVAQIVAEELGLDSESIEAALLHDVIEDTNATKEDLAKQFSPTVADLVDAVSKLTRISFAFKEDEQMENFRKMLFAMVEDIRVILIKIADRLHNMRTMEYQTQEKQMQKSLETMEIYAPIAHRLGMQRIKWELEDLSLKYLDPIAYNEIASITEGSRERYEREMAEMSAFLHRYLTEEKQIPNRVYSRLKHPYSIYRKMFVQHRSIEDIFDLFAFRVIVDTVEDCYNVLGVVHDLFNPIPGHFKDYIGTPKPNGYQSLHTIVMGKRGYPFEVQIRTQEMHEVAEYGVAAHWIYKLQGEGAGTEGKYEWVRRLLENQEGADAEEFIHTLKVDMFNDKVFVFTPNGDLKCLPSHATPIDFAYAIHSDVGNHMIRAKVNNRIVTLDHELKNGDMVEITTSPGAKGPSRDWMTIAKSSEAKNKIRQWFRRERKEENIANGRAALDMELRRAGLHLKDVTSEAMLPVLLKNTNYSTADELYAAIGYGGIQVQKVVLRIQSELKFLERQRLAEERQAGLLRKPEPPPQPAAVSSSGDGVVVEGLGNCLVKFARCCTPVPGDRIVGFITRGYGVSVHRADCPNASAEKRQAQADRWVKVTWSDQPKESYTTTLEILCKDRDRLSLDIFSALSLTQISVRGADIRATSDGFAQCHLEIAIRDNHQLEAVMKKLHQIPSVLEVKRPTG